jgi:CRP-like cAMP-binding protein
MRETRDIEAHEVFSFLRPEQVATVSSAAESILCKAGDTVYFKGTKARYLYVLLDGQVELRQPGSSGVSVVIDQLTSGAMFGSCVCMDLDSYSLTAQCVEDSKLLRIEASVLKQLMDNDPRMGYALQTRFSKIYFRRYVDTMQKLQAILLNIPFAAA